MAKVTSQKARKENKCSKCGKVISVGEIYLKGEPFRRPAICRCTSCGLQSWELSGSEFVLTCGEVANRWEEDYGIAPETVEDIKSDLEGLRDTCQDNYDNMPEGLQQGDTGCLLEERIEMLEGVIDELDCIDFDSIQEDAENEARDELEIFDEDEEIDDDKKEEYENLVKEKIEEAFREAVGEALSGLEY